MVKLTGEQRRAMIIEAGRRVARKDGVWAVTHGAVAKRCAAPTSASTVKHYFGSKVELLRAICEDDAALMQRALEQGLLNDS